MRILLGMACSKCQMCQDCQKGRRKGRKGQKKGPRKGRTTQQNIDSSGREIYEKGGQITVLTDKRCDVKSQTVEGKTYRVSYGLDKFTCECPYHIHGEGCRCKHIAAVQYMLLQETKSSSKGERIIDEAKLKCPDCKSEEYVKNGKDKECKSGEKQRFRCKKCNRRFRDNLGFERRQTAAVFITMALLLNGMGLGPARIQVVLKHMNVDVHVDTIDRWLEHYVGLVEKYTSPIRPPNLGSALGADEKRRDVKGKENYFVMAMELDTRFILAWCTTACKQSYDATKLLKAAVAKAGKPYPILITDGLAGYHIAFKKVFGSLKGFFMHIRDIHIRHEFTNTNKQERVNSTFAGHTDPARGINSENSLVYRIFLLHYNYVRPHSGIGGKTPAEAAGITIRGRDKWRTLIQNAAGAT